MSAVVLFRSRYGATERCARWLAEALGATCIDLAHCPEPDLAPYQTICYGSPLRMGHVLAAPDLRRHWPRLEGKRVLLFTCSASPPGHPSVVSAFRRSLPAHIRESLVFVPLRGRFHRASLRPWDRFLCGLARMIGLWQYLVQGDPSLYRGIGMDHPPCRAEALEALRAAARS